MNGECGSTSGGRVHDYAAGDEWKVQLLFHVKTVFSRQFGGGTEHAVGGGGPNEQRR
jgi:hypothetical protein